MKRFLGLLVEMLVLGTAFVFAEMPREQGTGGMGGIGQGKEMKHKMGRGADRDEDVGNIKRYLNFKQELNLTDEQVKALEQIRLDYRRDAIKRQADTKLARLDLREIMQQDKPDFAAAKSKIKQISELQLASKLAMIDAMEKGYNILTKEQQDKLPQLKKERKEKRMKRRTDGE
ncbi:MAG: Spy/CpxP family protein refolding chaperone [Elusimicrobiota bacterium]